MLAFAYHLIRVREQPILTIKEQSALKESLQCFLVQIPFETLARQIALEHGHEEAVIQSLFDTFANESPVTLDLILADLDVEHRMLEVGAGLCLTSLFLKQEGYPIVALEPALGGFGVFDSVKNAILKHFEYLQLEVMSVPAEQLNPDEHGMFDLVFSNYVIEHIPEWRLALEKMASVLTPEGKMLHSFPNYTIPYEPHYGVPVFRHFRIFSQRVFLPKGCDLDIWHSLNFITCREIRSFCKTNNLNCTFKKSLLYLAFKRIGEDPIFKQRHQGFAATLNSWLMRTGLIKLLKSIPPTYATPAIIEIRNSDAVPSSSNDKFC
ncbi:MAG: methyltransferase domain-containing protein [Mariprofundaceae bacterium]